LVSALLPLSFYYADSKDGGRYFRPESMAAVDAVVDR